LIAKIDKGEPMALGIAVIPLKTLGVIYDNGREFDLPPENSTI
jgi:hypothetical protein